ncbi:MAG: hypothetical protein NTV61_11100 [Candidatus Bathyarchaeota archaeon]|nr:hypothetical protein [Candidatus Bathyarchaeota archaeon]
MNRKLMVVFAVALLLVPIAPMALATATLTVQTGPKYYNAGDTVAIKGTAPANATVHVNVTYASVSVFSGNVVANSTGGYGVSYVLPSTAATGIYTVKATSGTLTDDTTFMVTTVSTAVMAQQLIGAAEKSQLLTKETIQAIKDEGYTVPSAVNASMTQGAAALAAAKAFYGQGSYVASAESAQRAMTHFKNAMTLAIRAGKTEDKTTEDENETLTHQVERLTGEAERLSEVLKNLNDAGKNVTAIEAKVASANASLTSASTLIGEGKYDEAAAAVKEARDSLREAMQLLKVLLKDVRKDLMEQFKNRLHDRLNATEDDLGTLKGHVKDSNMTAAMTRFGEANGFIKRAETRLKNGEDDNALNDLEEASNEFNLGLNEVDNNGYSQGMRQTNTIRAQIQVLQELAATLKEQGKDTSAVDAKIQELQTLLDEGMGMMQNGNAGGANKLFEDAEKGNNGMGHGNSGHGNGKND